MQLPRFDDVYAHQQYHTFYFVFFKWPPLLEGVNYTTGRSPTGQAKANTWVFFLTIWILFFHVLHRTLLKHGAPRTSETTCSKRRRRSKRRRLRSKGTERSGRRERSEGGGGCEAQKPFFFGTMRGAAGAASHIWLKSFVRTCLGHGEREDLHRGAKQMKLDMHINYYTEHI